jgi:hypothetical protein
MAHYFLFFDLLAGHTTSVVFHRFPPAKILPLPSQAIFLFFQFVDMKITVMPIFGGFQ